jgi:hypothetical protein
MDAFTRLLADQLRDLRDLSTGNTNVEEVAKLTEAMIGLGELIAKNINTERMLGQMSKE